jgi:Periplasmic binding protein
MCHIRLVIPIVLALLFVSSIQTARAQISDNVVRIGVLNDQSSIYADFGGPGSVVAARRAVEDAGSKVSGRPVEILVADHQGKADVGASIARQWFDTSQVDLVIGFDNSSVAPSRIEHNPPNMDGRGRRFHLRFAFHAPRCPGTGVRCRFDSLYSDRSEGLTARKLPSVRLALNTCCQAMSPLWLRHSGASHSDTRYRTPRMSISRVSKLRLCRHRFGQRNAREEEIGHQADPNYDARCLADS